MSLIITLIILVALSAYFSATETAFSTLNRIRIKNLAATNKRAALTLSLYEDYDRILSTILIGNNIVNIASASIATIVFTKYLHFFKKGILTKRLFCYIIYVKIRRDLWLKELYHKQKF